MKTPFHDKDNKLIFPYRPLGSIAFIFPTPAPKTLGKENLIELPEEFREYHQNKIGVILAIGPGYYDKKNRWIPTDSKLKPGTEVYFDNSVPWAVYILGTDMKKYKIVICVEADILGVISDE